MDSCIFNTCAKFTMVELGKERTMDDITFRSDTVLSDVHLHIPNKRHLMVRLNSVGQPVFLSQFQIIQCEDNTVNKSPQHEATNIVEKRSCAKRTEGETERNTEYFCNKQTSDIALWTSQEQAIVLDDDGDLDVKRKPFCSAESPVLESSREKAHPIILTKGYSDFVENLDEDSNAEDIIKIEHTMATTLEDVGKQVWRGAFLLGDYILCNRDLFRRCTVLELGAGTGLTSIIMATVAKTVYCTDVGEDLLNMCDRNIALNLRLIQPTGGEVKVKTLDWLKNELDTDPEIRYSWSEEEVSDLYDHTTVILGADVFYDDDLTDALFKTFYQITHNLKHPCAIYLAIEKRLNFTLRHMDITCDAYNHFQDCLKHLESLDDGKRKFTAELIETNFPQFLVYDRIEHLELWKISVKQLT